MALAREPIQAALYARLIAQVTGLKHTGRTYFDYASIGGDRMPAMIVAAGDQRSERDGNLPPLYHLTSYVYFYLRAPVKADQPAATNVTETQLFTLIEAAEAALMKQSGEQGDTPFTTLGLPQVLATTVTDTQIDQLEDAVGALLTVEMLVYAP